MKLTLAFAVALLCSVSVLADIAPRYQKPGAAIRLQSTEAVAMDPYSETSVTVNFSAPDSGELRLQVKAEEGLLVAENQHRYIIDLAAGDPQVTLTIKSSEAGRFHIMFHTSIDQGDTTSGRVFGLAVQVGPEQASDFQHKTAPTHIIMQGKERIY